MPIEIHGKLLKPQEIINDIGVQEDEILLFEVRAIIKGPSQSNES